MKVLRWILAVAIAFWGAWNLMPVGMTAAYKLGRLPKVLPPEEQRMIPLFAATPWWSLAVWAVAIMLYLAAAWRLFRGRKALMLYLAGLVLQFGNWLTFQGTDAYRQAFTPAELQADYDIWAGMVVVGVLVWLFERARPAQPAEALR